MISTETVSSPARIRILPAYDQSPQHGRQQWRDGSQCRAHRSTSNSLSEPKAGSRSHIWRGDTFKPGENVSVGSGITVAGTFQPEGNTVTLSGSWAKKSTGTFTFATSTVVMNGVQSDALGLHHVQALHQSRRSQRHAEFQCGPDADVYRNVDAARYQSARLRLRSVERQCAMEPQSSKHPRCYVPGCQKFSATSMQPSSTVSSGAWIHGNLLWNFGTFGSWEGVRRQGIDGNRRGTHRCRGHQRWESRGNEASPPLPGSISQQHAVR